MSPFGAFAIAFFVGLALWLGARGREIFFVSVRGRRLLVVRGRVPPGLLGAFADVVERERLDRASIRAVRDAGHARLVVSGTSDAVQQRLRNVFGTFPVARLKSAPPPSARNLGQWLGLAWLAWALVDCA